MHFTYIFSRVAVCTLFSRYPKHNRLRVHTILYCSLLKTFTTLKQLSLLFKHFFLILDLINGLPERHNFDNYIKNRLKKWCPKGYDHSSNLEQLVYKVLSFLEACFDLISDSSLSRKIQIMGGKITENLGFKSPLRKVKKFPFFFIFIFKFFTQKWISFILTTF
jgi:hypothetical protein